MANKEKKRMTNHEHRTVKDYRLIKLYKAAQEEAHPKPGLRDYRVGDNQGFNDAFSLILDFLKVTDLKNHVKPQYTFGYYDGVARAFRQWAEQMETDRLVPEEDEG